jgi:ABC-type Fe3+ transport system permease subunit
LRFTRKAVPGVLLRVLEGAQLILILAYCSLSRSFESAVALLFLLACVALTLNKRYIYDKKREVLLGHFAGESLRPLQTRRVLWAVFLTLQVLFTIFKTVYFTTDVIHLDRSMQESLEVQSLVYAFVPCVFLGTTPALILIKHRKKPLEEFK